MKRIGKTLIIAGGLLFIGLIIMAMGTGIIIGRGGRSSGSTPAGQRPGQIEYETKTYAVKGSDIQTLVTDLTYEDVRIEPTDGDEIKVEYQDVVGDPRYEVTELNGTLIVSQKMQRTGTVGTGQWFQMPVLTSENFRYGTATDSGLIGDIVVQIPADYIGDYQFSYTSGSVDMANITTDGSIESDFTSGSLNLANVDLAGDLVTDYTSGRVTCENVSVGGNMYADYTSGSCSYTSGSIVGDFQSTETSGGVRLENVTVWNVRVETTSGGVKFDMLTLGNAMSVDATSATVRATLTDRPEQYTIHSETESGSNNLPTDTGTRGDKSISVETTSGTIDFKFAE